MMAERIICALALLGVAAALLFGVLCIAANHLWKTRPRGGDDDWRVE